MISKALCDLATNCSLNNSVIFIKPCFVLGTILETGDTEWIRQTCKQVTFWWGLTTNL